MKMKSEMASVRRNEENKGDLAAAKAYLMAKCQLKNGGENEKIMAGENGEGNNIAERNKRQWRKAAGNE
jgi:hypothetical protein